MAVVEMAAARTDMGCVRDNNEDKFGGDAEQHVYVVCDGMGGVAGGEVASSIAVETFLQSFREELTGGGADEEAAKNALFRSALAANGAVRDRADTDLQYRGMGATLVGAHIIGDRLLVINVGDSRAYLVRDGECTQLTEDHTFLSEQVRLGMMTQEMAEASPLQSVITRAIGIEDVLDVDLFRLELEDGDVALLASDGLTRYVTDEEIAARVSGDVPASQLELDQRCANLIGLARERGGADNITCVLLQFALS